MNPKVTYRQLIEQASSTLNDSSDTPKTDAERLLQHIVAQNSAWLIAHAYEPATKTHISNFKKLVTLRKQGQPIAYLTGFQDFWTLRLNVNQHVLIPRADSETVVEQALARLDNTRQHRVLDLGTGSGAIALSIAKERPLAQVTAVDADNHALDIAKLNCAAANLNNVSFVQSDWFAELDATAFDLIVSNPPYVAANDPHLRQGDLRFEPQPALVGGNDGLQDLQTIITRSPHHLQPCGWLLVEHGYNQQPAVTQLFSDTGFSKVTTYADLNNLPRCTAGQWLL